MALGVGLIGTGYMGKCHALAWNAVAPVFGDCERPRLAVLAEVDAGLAGRRAAEFGFARATADWRDLVADPEVDVVSITTPNGLHAEMAIAALQAGKHVWCEKPMAPRIEDAERMRQAAEAAGRVAILGYNYIQNPVIRQIGASIRQGAIGAVNHIRVEMDEDFMAEAEAPFFWKSESASGYGALDDFAVHPLSILQMLFGNVTRVVADMAKPYADRPFEKGRREVENHDIASVLMRLEGGHPRHASGPPRRARPQGPHRIAGLRLEGLDPLRPGTHERIPDIRGRRGRGDGRLPDGAGRALPPTL